MLIIDCHAHIYGEDEQKYPPIDKPYRPAQEAILGKTAQRLWFTKPRGVR